MKSYRYTVGLVFAALVALAVIPALPFGQQPSLTSSIAAERWSGADRFSTAAYVARKSYPAGAQRVYLASAFAFADPMVAGQAAPPGPILFAGVEPLPRATCQALHELSPSMVIAIGGTASINERNLTTAQTCAAHTGPVASEQRLVQLLNEARRNEGLNELRVSERFSHIAVAWSEKMAMDGQISHGSPPDGRFFRWGENVAMAPNADKAHEVLMNSEPHRRNIMGSWDSVGIGVVVHEKSIWVTQQFVKEE